MTIYKGFDEAKNGSIIPVFLSGRSMESRYNPQRDAEALCNSIEAGFSFFLVLGIGSGLFLEKLLEKFPHAKIIAVERYNDDIDFLLQNSLLKKINNDHSLVICSLDQLEKKLIENYIPAKYGNLKIIEQRAWINENSEITGQIKSIIEKGLGIISADYSVQAHFGKLWTSNILNNAVLAARYETVNCFDFTESQLNKIAVIIAAGPSLDRTISMLSASDNYFIIATDTASLSLLNKGIIPDVIISIDGQAVSYNHFLNKKKSSENGNQKQPLYGFDLCSNTSALQHIISSGGKFFFFSSGHPLASAINSSLGLPFPSLFSGAGTVTITALDFALQAGFKKLIILGADFSYQNGKAYTSGTYLDALYNKDSYKLYGSEQNFAKLMFRTELKEISPNIKTTQILEAYKTSMENYLSEKNISFTYKDNIYSLECNDSAYQKADKNKSRKNSHLSLKPFFDNIKASSPEEIELLLLPYLAWLRNRSEYQKLSYSDLLKLALDDIVRYNI